jgi:tetratricopeptide (TPR) repeat protein
MCSPQELPDDELSKPIPPDKLGLPANYNPEFIPKKSDLQRAAIMALDRETAFVILHQDEPDKIVERLDKIADVARAASQIEGNHQAKAIKLGLELRLHYWMAGNKMDEWVNLIMPLLETALNIKDRELQSRIYHAWSLYLYIARDRPTAVDITLEAASDYAEESGRADLKLLARAERFNAGVLKMTLQEAQTEAQTVLVEAKQLKYDYVQGRAYLSLARACENRGLHTDTFAYAQQALVFFAPLNVTGLAGECVNFMLGSLIYRADYSAVYRSRLLDYLERLSQRSANPLLQAALSYYQGVQNYHLENYDRARDCMLHARRKYTAAHYRPSVKRCAHMLGLIQTKRGQWKMAERHLNTAFVYYADAGEKTNAVQAQYALAFIPFEQSDWMRARPLLQITLEMAQELPDEAARDRLMKLIQTDIEEVDRRIAGEESR